MFRKIVSNLSFSPALVGQLGFYAKRLRKEEMTRRVGLVFVALALVVQALSVFQPPESANAASPNDLVYGGIRPADGGLSIFLSAYDSNANGLRDIMNSFGLTRAEIAASQHGAYENVASLSDSWYSVNHRQQGNPGEQTMKTTNTSTGAEMTFYTRPWYRTDNKNPTLWGFKGYSAGLAKATGNGTFYLMDICGNLIIKKLPPPPSAPCLLPGLSTLPATSKECREGELMMSKSATNTSQGNVDATTVTAKAGDQISYILTATNKAGADVKLTFKDDLKDTLEYATLLDNGGGTFDNAKQLLTWPEVTIKAGGTQSRTFVVKLKTPIPATAVGASDPVSFDCRMTNIFGTQTTIAVDCATPKVVETVVTQLPKTGPTENIIFAGAVLAIATYFYARTRQVNKEIRLIRRDLNAGTI